MRRFDQRYTVQAVADHLKRMAAQGHSTGQATPAQEAYRDQCLALHLPTGTIALLTRDTQAHECGYWKNPDYDKCLHLSLSFRDPKTAEKLPRNAKTSREFVEAVFGDYRRLIWTEPPFSSHGKRSDVWHYRLFFADAGFLCPILPRGEVYTREFTEAGWLSWSDAQAKLAAEEAAATERAMNP